MTHFWNLQTKFIGVLVVLLLGSLATQSYFHERSKESMRNAVFAITEDVANEASAKVPQLFYVVPPTTQTRSVKLIVKTRPEGKLWSRTSGQRKRVRAESRGDFRHNLRFSLEAVSENLRDLVEVAESQKSQNFDALREEMAQTVEQLDLALRDRVFPAFEPRKIRVPRVEVHIDPQRPLASSAEPGSGRAIETDRPAGQGFPLVQAMGANNLQQINIDQLTSQLGSQLKSQEPLDLTPHGDRFDSIYEEFRRKDLLATMGIFLLGIGLAWFLGVRMTRPVNRLVEGLQRVADGDLETQVQHSRGEFGVLGQQFNSMIGRLRENRELQRELELRERVQHMGDLAAGVAHDVRNPLNAIHLNVGHIRDQFEPEDPDRRERFLRHTQDVQHEVERLNQLVTNFLSLAQPSSGEKEPLEPNELVHELVRLLDKEAGTRRVEIAASLEEGLPTLRGDSQELKSAFLNVAMNALQSMEPQGGGSLDIVTGRRNASGGVEEVAITFVDSGIGIAEDDLNRIFLPYFTTRDGGTGLGMAISQRIAERHGGRIEVRSCVGEGTTVSFVFPIAATGEEVSA